MNTEKKGSSAPSSVILSFELHRNTTSPDEKETGVRSFVFNFPVKEILKVGTSDNLRDYIAEDNPKKRNRVHDAIRNTIDTEPKRFITRNSGFAITASDIEVDDTKKTVKLVNASIINGAQSQGELKRWLSDRAEDGEAENGEAPFHVRAEVIVDPDHAEVVETAIARNTATPVQSVTQAGKRGHLDDLERSMQMVLGADVKIRKSETDTDVIDTIKVLQYARLLMPRSISKNDNPAEVLRAYKNPAQCLKDFSAWYADRGSDPESKAKYDFTVQIAPHAYRENKMWETHDGWMGHRLWETTKKGGRACRRDKKTNKVVWVAPGLVFPILSAVSEFIVQGEDGKWAIRKPSQFEPAALIAHAAKQFRSNGSDTSALGRNSGAYEALRTYPETLMKVLRDTGQTE